MGMEDEDQGEGEQDGHGEGVARPEIQRRSSRSGGPTITPDRWLLFLIPNLGYLMKKRRGRILRKSPEQGETSLVDPVFGTIHWEQCRFVAAGMDNEEQKQNEAMVLLAAWFSHSSQLHDEVK
ncbi:uncharacterized protein [Aegilops tauschii subsp. strangulata]|uniref:uncharacterized protein isoform X2 n=1 Tax=Aegilops tauschii subsp. strangulata TaxID=200361 RepID=UPI001E1CA061|nr:uncharacterized protein LOC109752917 isoform X2 [Aegilops tauschii subsp. strangulata]